MIQRPDLNHPGFLIDNGEFPSPCSPNSGWPVARHLSNPPSDVANPYCMITGPV